MSSRGYVSGSLLKTIIDVAEVKGASVKSMLAMVDLNGRDSDISETRYPTEKVMTLMDNIVSQTGDQAFGLHVGQNIKPGSLNSLGYALMSSKNLHEALKIQKAFGGVISDSAELKVNIGGKFIRVSYTVIEDNENLARLINDLFMSTIWNYANWITRTDGRLSGLTFTHSSPPYKELYEDIFGIMPEFGASECSFIFDKKYLEDPLYQADKNLNSLMRERTESLLHKTKSSATLYAAVAHQVRKLMPCQKATLILVASALNMSERSLSRKLKEEGYSFKSVLVSVRESLALEYLNDPTMSVNEIANKLGYRDYSAFSHAFRCWTGQSPSEYRERNQDDK